MKKKLVLIAAVLIVAALTISGAVREDAAPEKCAAETQATEAAAVIEPIPPAVRSAAPREQKAAKAQVQAAPAPEVVEDEQAEEPKITEDEQQETPALWREDVPLSAELQAVLLEACELAGVDPLLMLGLIETESSFRVDAVSKTDDHGLCQLNAAYFNPNMTPEENLRTGINLLGQYMGTYKDAGAALTAYHWGYDNGTRSYAAVVTAKAEAWGYAAG